ncbi:hypothetical protein ACVIOG_002985 [Rhizobium leguminosarum]|jgi:hypothetical protein
MIGIASAIGREEQASEAAVAMATKEGTPVIFCCNEI